MRNTLLAPEPSPEVAPHNAVAEAVIMTDEMALHYLEDCSYSGQRDLRQHWVDHLANQMRQKVFGHSTVTLAKLGDKLYLIDGQHRLWAVVSSGCRVSMTVNTVFVETMDELTHLYAVMDTGVGRTPFDAFGGVKNASYGNLGQQRFNQLYAGTTLLITGFRNPRRRSDATIKSRDIRHAALEEMVPAFQDYLHSVRGCDATLRPRLMLAPCLAVALVTYQRQKEKADEFWRVAAHNEMLRAGDPRRSLVNYLLTTNTVRMGGPSRMARSIATAWNAFYNNKSQGIIKPPDGDAPILIEGSEYDGEHYIERWNATGGKA